MELPEPSGGIMHFFYLFIYLFFLQAALLVWNNLSLLGVSCTVAFIAIILNMGSRHTFSKVSALAHSLCKDTTKSIFANICASHSCFEHGEQAHILESSNISYMYVGNV